MTSAYYSNAAYAEPIGASATLRMSDAALLEAFLQSRSESAFTALVHRHGPMVYAVCRRKLQDPHDAEDAFQVVFLVLMQRAHTIRPRDKVAPWLHGVAVRTALKSRTLRMRRQQKESEVPPREDRSVPAPWETIAPFLDEELLRLPEKFRVPVILCDLQGQTRSQAAQQLAIPEGTISSRLARGRDQLRARMQRRGFVARVWVADSAVLSAMPAALTEQTISTAMLAAAGKATLPVHISLLTKGVLHAMFIAKAKFSAVLVAAALMVSTGVSVTVYAGLGRSRATATNAVEWNIAKEGAVTAAPSTHAVIVSIDGDKVTLGLNVDGKKTTRECTLAGNADISFQPDVKGEHVAGTKSDLVPGAGVDVTLSPDGATIESVMVLGATVRGTVTAADDKSITVTSKSKAGVAKSTYSLTKDVVYVLSTGPAKGQAEYGKSSDIAEGMAVAIGLSAVDKTLVKQVTVEPAPPVNPKTGLQQKN